MGGHVVFMIGLCFKKKLKKLCDEGQAFVLQINKK
jgi:hypothetical protein